MAQIFTLPRSERRPVVAFYVDEKFEILDLTGPVAVLSSVREIAAAAAYSLKVVSASGGLVCSSCGVSIDTIACENVAPDTLIVVGGALQEDVASSVSQLVHQVARSKRIAAVANGAFLLAEAGVLAGVRIAINWRHVRILRQCYPEIKLDPGQVCIKDGPVWSSANASASIDLALGLIAEDHGDEMSRAVAQELSLTYRRAANSQYVSTLERAEISSSRIRDAMNFCQENIGTELSVDRLAERAHLSTRQFTRLFVAEIGLTPAKAIEQLRVDAARRRIETTPDSLYDIARDCGFTDIQQMRRAFVRIFQKPPQSIRREERLRPQGAN